MKREIYQIIPLLFTILIAFSPKLSSAQKILNLDFNDNNGELIDNVNDLNIRIIKTDSIIKAKKIVIIEDSDILTGHQNKEYGYSSLTMEIDFNPQKIRKSQLIKKIDDKTGLGYELSMRDSGELFFSINNGKNQYGRVISKRKVKVGESHKVIAIWDSRYEHYNMQLHIDGFIAWGGSGPTTRLLNTEAPLTIAGHLDKGGGYKELFYGQINNVKLSYNTRKIFNLSGKSDPYEIEPTGKHLMEQSGYNKGSFVYEIPPTPECHASTIVDLGNGEIGAAWFGGTHEGHTDVAIWFSVYNGNEWSKPKSIIRSPSHNLHARISLFNPVLFKHSSGTLMLFYKEGWVNSMECRMITSEDNGITWSQINYLENVIKGPSKNKLLEGAGGQLISPSSSKKIELSYDKGLTWEHSLIENPNNYFGVIQPSLLAHKGDSIQALFRTRESRIAEAWSLDAGKTWSPLSLTSLPNNNSGIDSVSLFDGRFILVSNPTVIPNGKWGGPRTPLTVSISVDGIIWKEVIVLEDESGEYSYPSVIQSTDGLIHILYTWKRIRMKHVIINPKLIK